MAASRKQSCTGGVKPLKPYTFVIDVDLTVFDKLLALAHPTSFRASLQAQARLTTMFNGKALKTEPS